MPLVRRSELVLDDTGTEMNVTSDPVKGDGYYGYTDGRHTLAVRYNNFQGRFYIQATIALEPTEDDWFNIQVTGGVSPTLGGYKQFPFSGTDPYTGTEAYTFVGNFTHIRVKIDRSYLGDGVTWSSEYGAVGSVRLSA